MSERDPLAPVQLEPTSVRLSTTVEKRDHQQRTSQKNIYHCTALFSVLFSNPHHLECSIPNDDEATHMLHKDDSSEAINAFRGRWHRAQPRPTLKNIAPM
jgi:hypothetical protein